MHATHTLSEEHQTILRVLACLEKLLTDDAHAVTRTTVEDLRSKGLTDEDVLNVVQITGFFNYYNRMADALGVEPEDFMPPLSTTGAPAPK